LDWVKWRTLEWLWPHLLGIGLEEEMLRRLSIMSSNPKTLYDRVGGDIAIAMLVDRFYDRVLKDTELEPYFRHVPMEKLREMQLEFFSAALDGPAHYSGRSIDDVHKGKGITSRQLTRFMHHLLATIQFLKLSEREVSEMYSRIGLFGDSVIDGSGEGSE
jgi:hemoglobin